MPEETREVTTVYIFAHSHPLYCKLQFRAESLVEIPADIHDGYEFRPEPICTETGQFLELIERKPNYPRQHELAVQRRREEERNPPKKKKKKRWWHEWQF